MHPTPLQRLRDNRLMRSSTEVAAFEEALKEIVIERDAALLRNLHLIIDDDCRAHEVMFGLIHLVESFDLELQLQALLEVLPQLADQAPKWTRILHFRILNDGVARREYGYLLSQAAEPSRSIASAILTAIAVEEEEPLKSSATSVLKAMRR